VSSGKRTEAASLTGCVKKLILGGRQFLINPGNNWQVISDSGSPCYNKN
jgi:hypothetical protein